MDWKSLIADLKACGWSQPKLAERLNCGQATITDLSTGTTTEPRYGLGQRLRALHRIEMAKAARQKVGA